MKNSRRLFPCIMFAVFICLPMIGVPGQTPIREALRRMDVYNRSLTTLKAEVRMVKRNTILGEDDVSTGTVLCAKQPKKDALMRLDWKKPEESMAVVDGEYRVFRPRLKEAYKGSIRDLDKPKTETRSGATLAFSFMNTSSGELNSRYEVSLVSEKARLSSGIETFQLKLTPKVKMKFESAELWVDPHGMPVQIRINETKNDSTTILLTGPQPNILLKKSEFIIDWPAGTKVSKL